MRRSAAGSQQPDDAFSMHTFRATSLRADAIASSVDAAATRREVLQIYGGVLGSEKLTDEAKDWVMATMAEAYLGMGNQSGADRTLEDAFKIASAQWMKDSTQDQMNKLRGLLASSPLRFIRAD